GSPLACLRERGAEGGVGIQEPHGRVGKAGWLADVYSQLALGAILLLATGLNVVGLDREAYGNTYYAAAVKSMLTSWHAFFFASFDSGGFVSVDKPPVGLWAQTASAWLFGFNGLSLLLPQAVAGVLAALWAAYLLLAPIGWRARVWRLALATAALLVVSLSWSAVVDLTPASARPFVGSSGSNSALSLALGYNGLGRLTQALAAHIP